MTVNKKREYINEALKTPISGEYDVVVCGGGVAGIASALASARAGAKTVLLEKSYVLGGLATAGLVTIYLPLCDGNGRQVSFSIAEELLKLSISHGAEFSKLQALDIDAWLTDSVNDEIMTRRQRSRYQVQFNHNVFTILCEELLLKEGVKILYGTSICQAVTGEDKIEYVICENKNGRFALSGKAFIDSTGDADLCVFSGEKTDVYQRGNVLASWYYEHTGDELALKMLGYCEDPNAPIDEQNSADNRYIGLDSQEISIFLEKGRRNILSSFLEGGEITKEHSLATIPTLPQFRMTRKLVADYEIDESDDGKEFADSVGLFSNWKQRGPVYEMPLASLRGVKNKNLFVSGRCISVSQRTWDVTRVIPVCAVSGEASGVAAALVASDGKVDVKKLQSILLKNGVKLHKNSIN